MHYFHNTKFSLEEGQEKKIGRFATKYTMLAKKLYKMEKASLLLRCLGENEIVHVLVEAVHEELCRSLIGGG